MTSDAKTFSVNPKTGKMVAYVAVATANTTNETTKYAVHMLGAITTVAVSTLIALI